MIADPSLQLQSDIHARLCADPFLAPYGVALVEEGVNDSDVTQALGPERAGGIAGKQWGTLISVLPTEDGRNGQPNVPGPQEEFTLTVRVMVIPKTARAAAKAVGVPYLSFTVLAQYIKRLCDLCQLGTAPVLYQRAEPVTDGQGTIGKDVRFTWKPSAANIPAVRQPTIIPQPDGSLVLATNTAGATIYVTEDGSYPAPGNALHESAAGAPLNVPAPPAGAMVRASAYKDGWLPSGVSELLVA